MTFIQATRVYNFYHNVFYTYNKVVSPYFIEESSNGSNMDEKDNFESLVFM